MRKRFEIQYELGAVPIEKVKIPTKSRDQMPDVLRALQYIYITPELNSKVFALLEQKVLKGKKKTGRPGMTLWEILVLATARLARDADFDHLHYIADSDRILRALLGANEFGEDSRYYELQTIKDNVGLLDEALLVQINDLVVEAGHQLVKKNENEDLDVKIDSYVLESNVHFPTDLNLLLDAGRKCAELAHQLIRRTGIPGWRKSRNWVHRLKSHCRTVGKLSVSGGRNKAQRVREAALAYLDCAEVLKRKLEADQPCFRTLAQISRGRTKLFKELTWFSFQLAKHIDLVRRRLIYGETIAHAEKDFSLFEPYTEWIKKGKAGDRPELGLPIVIAKDQFGFVLKHRVMQRKHDVEVAVPLARELVQQYAINSLSFDKNFWSQGNHQSLAPLVPVLVMPKKGRRNKQEEEREHSKPFSLLRRQHASVESTINALEHHGLNRCPDKGLDHFKTYTALGILAYNLHKLGSVLRAKEQKAMSRNRGLRKAA